MLKAKCLNKSLIAVSQMRSSASKKDNLRQINEIVSKAKEKSIKFLFFPECCDFVSETPEQTLEMSETLTGETVKLYQNLAKQNELWLSFGGFHESILDVDGSKTNKIFNTHIIINDMGNIVCIYRKLHLFDVDTENFKFRESNVVTKGTEIVSPLSTPIGNIGLQICYDLRFSESSIILRKQGADILTYPSAFANSTGQAHWEVLLRARAIETQCYVIAAAQHGWHNKNRQSYGHAMIVDPLGNILAECNNDNEIDIAFAEIDLNIIEEARQDIPCTDHRRTDIYSLIALQFRDNTTESDMLFGPHTIHRSTIFYKSEYCFAFTNIRCVVPGHVLVATKRIAPRLENLTNDEISDLFQSVVKIQKIIEPFYNATSSHVAVQDGIDAGQTVKHVHFHVMPRKKGDFKDNDEYFIELDKHDHPPEKSIRDLQEMIEEAQNYKAKLREF